MPRQVDFFDGQQSSTTPTFGSLNRTVTGTDAVPIAIVAGTGIEILDVAVEMIFIESSTAGQTDISANPQIEAGTIVGQELNLIGTSDVKTVVIEDGDGVQLNGNILMDSETTLNLLWTGVLWKEMSRA